MEHSIQNPLILGNYYYGGGEMAWGWWLQEHAQLAIVGDRHLSPRKKFVQELTEVLCSRDPKSVFTITYGDSQLGEVSNIRSIPWVEDFPDPPDFFDDRQIFIDNRHHFSQTYFNLIAKAIDVPRSKLIPPISFQPHLEGPLPGYKRAIERLNEDVPYKEYLLKSLMGLAEVPWIRIKNEGFKYFIDPKRSLFEQAISFLKAAWSFWALTCQTESPQQMLLVIEIPKDLLRPEVDPVIQKTILQTLRILNYVSFTTTTTIILSSEMLFPAPELNYRYKLLFQTKDADLDYSDENVRNMIDPALFSEWDRGNNNVGIWMDDLADDEHDRSILVKIGEQTPFFWDDFGTSDS